jgi:LmbE family N-acetylglucosaminyl deacetylase
MDLRERCRGAQVLVLSPHLDDAVFSCGGLLAELQDPIVVTVFAGFPLPALPLQEWDAACGFCSGGEAVTVRREEDDAALRVLCATPEHLNFLDSQYGASPPLAELTQALDALIAARHPDIVLLPLGLQHGDHVLLCDAALAGAARTSWIAYEDVPYRSRPGLVQQRLSALLARGINATPLGPRADASGLKRAAMLAYRSQWRAHGHRGFEGDEIEGYWLLERAP